MMRFEEWNYLFETENAGIVFVVATSYAEARRIAFDAGLEITDYIGRFSDCEADAMGYDTY